MKERVCIYSSDLEVLTGKGARHCRDLIREMRIYFNKKKHQMISYCDAADFLGVPREVVLRSINNQSVETSSNAPDRRGQVLKLFPH